jgi:hypothetical protein
MNQPLVTLHGHIHEAPEISGAYMDRLGDTVMINPGQFICKNGDFSKLHAVTFDTEIIEETLMHTCLPTVRKEESPRTPEAGSWSRMRAKKNT